MERLETTKRNAIYIMRVDCKDAESHLPSWFNSSVVHGDPPGRGILSDLKSFVKEMEATGRFTVSHGRVCKRGTPFKGRLVATYEPTKGYELRTGGPAEQER